MKAEKYGEIGLIDKMSGRLGSSIPPQRDLTEFVTDAGIAMAGGFVSTLVLDSIRKIFDITTVLGDIGEPLLVIVIAYALKRMTDDNGNGYRWADTLASGMLGATASRFGTAVSDLISGRRKAPSNAMGLLGPTEYNRLADLTMDALVQSGQFVPQNQGEADATRNALRRAIPVAAQWVAARS